MRQSFKTWLLLVGVFVIIAGAGAYLTLRKTGVKRISGDISGDIGGDRQARRAFRTEGLAGKIGASQAVLAYLKAPGAGTLKEALQACLSVAERNPDDVLNNFLLAFCYHEMKDPAAEAAALSRCRPEQRDMYRFCFYEHRGDLADALYYLPGYLCSKLRESHNSMADFPPGSVCPFFGGPISRREYRRGDRTVARFICPKCDGMIKLQEDRFMGNVVDHNINKNNPLISVFPSFAVLLEDRKRARTDKPGSVSRIIDALDLKEGMTVADIGAGIGQFSFLIAERVGPKGKVYAEDIDEGMIGMLKYCVGKEGVKNVVPVLGTPDDMKLPPASLDMAVLIHVYWGIVLVMDEQGPKVMDTFFDGFFAAVHKALKKDGVLVLVDHADPQLDISIRKVVEELKKRGFRPIANSGIPNDRNFVLSFKKTGPAAKH